MRNKSSMTAKFCFVFYMCNWNDGVGELGETNEASSRHLRLGVDTVVEDMLIW